MIAFRGLHKGEAQKLGQGQGRGDGGIQNPRAEPFPAARLFAVPKHGIGAASQRQKHQRQIAMGMQKGQSARHHAQHHQRPGFVLFAPAQRRKQQVQAGRQHGPASQQAPLGDQQIHHNIGPAQVIGVGLIGGGLIVALYHRAQVIPEGIGHAVLHPA